MKKFHKNYLVIIENLKKNYLTAPGLMVVAQGSSIFVASHKIFFSGDVPTLSCGMWDLVPRASLNPGPGNWSVESEPLDHQGSPNN